MTHFLVISQIHFFSFKKSTKNIQTKNKKIQKKNNSEKRMSERPENG